MRIKTINAKGEVECHARKGKFMRLKHSLVGSFETYLFQQCYWKQKKKRKKKKQNLKI